MTLERAIAGVFVVVCLAYGYTAFVTMEAALLPFERNMVFLPNVLPKWLSVLGAIAGFLVAIRPGKSAEVDADGIDVRRLGQYNLGQALLLLGLMVGYAVALRPIGFVPATTLFLVLGGVVLGERRYAVLAGVSVFAALAIWYLVQEVLGIFLRPWPW